MLPTVGPQNPINSTDHSNRGSISVSAGSIAGIAIGGVLFVALGLGGFFYLRKRAMPKAAKSGKQRGEVLPTESGLCEAEGKPIRMDMLDGTPVAELDTGEGQGRGRRRGQAGCRYQSFELSAGAGRASLLDRCLDGLHVTVDARHYYV